MCIRDRPWWGSDVNAVGEGVLQLWEGGTFCQGVPKQRERKGWRRERQRQRLWKLVGGCWKCGNVGHKSFECNKWKVSDVESGLAGGQAERGKDAMSVEIGAVWNLCPVEVSEVGESGDPGVEELISELDKLGVGEEEPPEIVESEEGEKEEVWARETVREEPEGFRVGMDGRGVWEERHGGQESCEVPRPSEREAMCHCCFEDLVRPSYLCRKCEKPHHLGCMVQEEPGRYVCQVCHHWEIGNLEGKAGKCKARKICPVAWTCEEGCDVQGKKRMRLMTTRKGVGQERWYQFHRCFPVSGPRKPGWVWT
eukprot:12412491-Karenia_brevis.AAC.1